MATPRDPLALVYSTESHVESPFERRRPGNKGPFGRVVAGSRFVDAYLHHGANSHLIAIVPDKESIASLESRVRSLSETMARSHQVTFIGTGAFHKAFFPVPPARIIHNPGPISLAQSWARATHGPHAFALSGVIHAQPIPGTFQQLIQAATAPLLPYDVLICSSHAARHSLQTLFSIVRSACGATSPGPRLEVIPWGVDPNQFCPATNEQQAAARHSFGIASEEVVVLCVGRLSVHSRANPYPLLQGLYHAARLTQRKVRLLLVGWPGNDAVLRAWLDAARVYAPTVTTTHCLGDQAEERTWAYHAANLFADFPDSYQQSHGLAILEAMACGLPVVSSDWAGVRDLVESEHTGLLVPTTLLANAAEDFLTRMLQGELSEDQFLAQTSQSVIVDPAGAVQALTRMLTSPDLARTMGQAGRRSIEEKFTWRQVIASHDRLWEEQETLRAEYAALHTTTHSSASLTPGHLFASYAHSVVDATACVQAVEERETMLHRLSKVALTAFAGEARCTDLVILRAVLDAAARPVPMTTLFAELQNRGVARQKANTTLAWMLKYGLLALCELTKI